MRYTHLESAAGTVQSVNIPKLVSLRTLSKASKSLLKSQEPCPHVTPEKKRALSAHQAGLSIGLTSLGLDQSLRWTVQFQMTSMRIFWRPETPQVSLGKLGPTSGVHRAIVQNLLHI